MFDGIGIMCSSDHHDYLSQFINASRTSSLLDDHIHCNPCFDPSLISSSLDNSITQGERSVAPWSNEEVVELFKFRSSMEGCTSLPELISWGHVSRRLAEIGFKRSAVECKEKFEQGKSFNNVISCKDGRVCNELHEFYLHDHPEEIQVSAECGPAAETKDGPVVYDQKRADNDVAKVSENNEAAKEASQKLTREGKSKRKRKEGEVGGALRGYFEAIVDKVMARQEELHNELIASIIKRDEERMAREEEWKIQEIKRSKTAMQMRAKDQANAEERQATIIQFLKKFQDQHVIAANKVIHTGSSPSRLLIPSLKTNPISSRWPREEVLALINMRCKVSYNSKEGQMKGPLWERISQGMMELGYKRSAKRCKEKWENINKYFRKTKDGHKKRPVDARTCPYFHELSCLYSGRSITALVDTPEPSGEEQQQQSQLNNS